MEPTQLGGQIDSAGHPLELRNLLEARGIDEDEASHDAEGRLKKLGFKLLSASYGRSATDAAVQREWYAQDLVAL